MKNLDISVSDIQQYIKDALMTESNKYDLITQQFSSPRTIRLMHSFIGINTEFTEFFELLEKKPFDLINLREEAGDVFWYVAIALDELKIDLDVFLSKVSTELAKPKKLSQKLIVKMFKKHSFRTELIKATVPAGTLLDMMKKYTYYVSNDPKVPKRTLDLEKIENLLAQVFIHVVQMLEINEFKVKETLIINIKKLQKDRYKKGKFSEEEAVNRNLQAERATLEGK